jgi:glycosyltransferase involved in cell wall biosynthesis
MRLSVIFTTYNQPVWLEKVLWGFEVQTFRDFEVIIADDGSDAPTRELVDRLRGEVTYPIEHVFQPHDGFGKCRILNKAIARASGEYCFFTDGDCVPRADLLAVHAKHARRGSFLSGGYLKLPMVTSDLISKENIVAGQATDYRWLRRHGVPASRQLSRLRWKGVLATILDVLTPTIASFNGHNASVWRDDLITVNGFDERLQWGGLDRELGERLENAGVRGRQFRHRALVVHLDHPRSYKTAEGIAANRAIRNAVRKGRLTRAAVGLDQYMVNAR